MSDLIYSDSGAVTLDASGFGTVILNGPASLTTRKLSTIVIACTSSTPRPTCSVYRSSIQPARLMVRTRLGDSDTLIADGETLSSGEPLYIVWTGGAPGATARANANGTDTRA